MGWFPFFVSLKGKRGLLAGGGRVALRKAEKLLEYGAQLKIVSPEFCGELLTLDGVKLEQRRFEDGDLEESLAFVIAATDDPQLNHHIAEMCKKKRIWVNVVDDPEFCTFFFPALIHHGPLSVGISTAGASPTAAVWLKKRIEKLIPPGFGTMLERLGRERQCTRDTVTNQEKRAEMFRTSFELNLASGCAQPRSKNKGYVALVGAGCGKADLVTVRGLRLIQQCDAVVYDDLIDQTLLDQAPEQASRIYVGKRSGKHSMAQKEINELLIDLAHRGGLVVRLKGGDPLVFGRGGEEALALESAGVSYQIVPGISSAIAVPEEAGIPVTHRGMSGEFHVIAAHMEGETELDYQGYAKLKGTLIFLMGLQRLPQIAEDLIAGGMPGDTPAAVISGGNAPVPMAVRASLAQIAEHSAKAHVTAPAVIVIGETAGMNLEASALLKERELS